MIIEHLDNDEFELIQDQYSVNQLNQDYKEDFDFYFIRTKPNSFYEEVYGSHSCFKKDFAYRIA